MMARLIALGSGARVPVPDYLAALRIAKSNPSITYARGLRNWWPVTGAEIIREYRADMHDRINARGGLFRYGRVHMPRVHPSTWAIAALPRVCLEADRIASMNRHQRRHFAGRARTED